MSYLVLRVGQEVAAETPLTGKTLGLGDDPTVSRLPRLSGKVHHPCFFSVLVLIDYTGFHA